MPVSNVSSSTNPAVWSPPAPLNAPNSTPAPANDAVDTFEVSASSSLSRNPDGPSALQKHAMFFDRDGDGQITVSETQDGLVALGFGRVRSWLLATAINTGLGRITGAPWYSPLTIQVKNIAAGKHGSDTDIYDNGGQFNPQKFEQLFQNYDSNRDGSLSREEFGTFYRRNFEDSSSSTASQLEFSLLLEIAGENRFVNGHQTQVLTRETLAKFYDGTLFFQLAGEQAPF